MQLHGSPHSMAGGGGGGGSFCISDILLNNFGILFCSICIVGSRLRVDMTPKYIFALGPEVFGCIFMFFCSLSVTCFLAVLPAH